MSCIFVRSTSLPPSYEGSTSTCAVTASLPDRMPPHDLGQHAGRDQHQGNYKVLAAHPPQFVGTVVVAVTLMVVGMGYTPARRGREVNLRIFGCRSQSRWREQGREYPPHRFRTWSESPQVWSTSGHTLAIDKQIPKGRKAARAYLPPSYEVNLQLNIDAQRGTPSAGG
jgi:hypothetical protein